MGKVKKNKQPVIENEIKNETNKYIEKTENNKTEDNETQDNETQDDETEDDETKDDETEDDETENNETNEIENGTIIKIIKKRGRKPKIKTQSEIEMLETIKRHKIEKKENKIKMEELKKENKLNKIKNKTNNDNDNDNEDNGIMKTKRRGRKPKDKFKYENNDIEDLNHINKDENIIIKLPLSCLKLTEEFSSGKDLFQYNPTITEPLPYTSDINNMNNTNFEFIDNKNNSSINNSIENNINFNITNINNNNENNSSLNSSNLNNTIENKNNKLKQNEIQTYNQQTILNNINNNYSNLNETNITKKEPIRQIDIILNNKYNSNTDKLNVLTHLTLNTNGDKWITNTNNACLWCCHSFTNIPWGIPYKYIKNKFQLFGNFCLPNCALAYILQYYKDDDSYWEKISLLNLLYFKVFGDYKNLTPSIDKMALKLFGGKLDIDEYRNINGLNDKMYNIEFPPCNTIIPILEEIYKKTNLNNTFLPIDKKNSQPLLTMNDFKLKRNKPIINPKNTLDFCLKN